MADTVNYFSHPCLLDDLMENNVIKCDIDFGSTLLTEQELNSQASPSHESDSGCSDMSDELRSVSPRCGYSPIIEFDPFQSEEMEEDLDKELEMYFANPVPYERIRNDDERLETPLNVDVLTPENVSDHNGDSSDEDYVPPVKKLNPKVVHNTNGKKETVNKCVAKENEIAANFVGGAHNSLEKEARTPAVKVVKVIKTPAVSTKKDINNSIMQALDERNKKNAIQAKLNREKKKAYVKSLEEEIESLKMENYALKETNRKTEKQRHALENEVEYLHSVLANDSALSGLLKNINHVENVKLSSTLVGKRGADHDHDYPASKKPKLGAGVCLHVDQGNVSLEFCSKCSVMANHATEIVNGSYCE